MLCPGSRMEIRRAIEERLEWQRADVEFALAHMTTTGGFPGVTADRVSSKDFESVFGAGRETIRERLCITLPQRMVTPR
jgi:hypothetical protein